jgi:hypothetical protein
MDNPAKRERPRLKKPYVYEDQRLARELILAADALARVIGLRRGYYAVQRIADRMAKDIVLAEERTE